jgi:hypothetical protein
MTRQEFIDDYMQRSGISVQHRTDDGFHVPGSPRQSEGKIHPDAK